LRCAQSTSPTSALFKPGNLLACYATQRQVLVHLRSGSSSFFELLVYIETSVCLSPVGLSAADYKRDRGKLLATKAEK